MFLKTGSVVFVKQLGTVTKLHSNISKHLLESGFQLRFNTYLLLWSLFMALGWSGINSVFHSCFEQHASVVLMNNLHLDLETQLMFYFILFWSFIWDSLAKGENIEYWRWYRLRTAGPVKRWKKADNTGRIPHRLYKNSTYSVTVDISAVAGGYSGRPAVHWSNCLSTCGASLFHISRSGTVAPHLWPHIPQPSPRQPPPTNTQQRMLR